MISVHDRKKTVCEYEHGTVLLHLFVGIVQLT